MRDFLPADKARREHVLSVIRRTFRANGFDEIETPVVEDSARLHAGLGGDNEKLAFAVMKRDLKSDDLQLAADSGDYLDLADLGLRFDLTVPLARFYASHRAELPKVFRAIQIAPVWRAERPQKGRFRQFVQCDIDIIGEEGPLAEIELITATGAALDALGLDGCTIRINDRRILRRLTDHMEIPAERYERALITIDKEDKIGVDGVIAELADLGLGNDEIIRSVLPDLTAAPDDGWSLLGGPGVAPEWLDTEAYSDLLSIRAVVGERVRLVFAPNLVRGMGYYTGTIFEIAHPALPYSLGGGGRYDGMIGRFLGSDVPAAGFSLGFERLVDLVEIADSASEDSIVLIHDADVEASRLLALKLQVLASPPGEGAVRVRLEQKAKNSRAQLDRLLGEGYATFAFVSSGTQFDDLDFRVITAQ
jgi:histidyl-tRNA synthetase